MPAMKAIVTLTLNPCVDASSEAKTVYPTRKIRTTNERYDPGGGGINVARVVEELGGASRSIYLAGGATGSVLDDLMRARGMSFRRVDIAGMTRVSQSVFEQSTGLEYRFVPEGPQIHPSEWQRFLEVLRDVDAEYFVGSGSLPRGVPSDFYVRVGDIVRRKGAKFVLDTSGDALRETLKAGGVHLVKPSLGEFEQLAGRELREPAAQEESAMSFIRTGKADLMAVTLGHRGALLAGPGGVLRMSALPVKARSAVGAGDSFVGGMTLGLAKGLTAEIAFQLGMAAGTAAVLTPGTGLCKREDVESL
jgi:6-phosphofructokinase 2